MALTRINVETIVVGRLSNLMFEAGLAITVAGANADLNDPLARAVRMVGGATADYSTATAAEIAAVGSAVYDDMFDLAEYYTLKSIQGNLAAGHIFAGTVATRLDQLEVDLLAYLMPLTPGYISLDFAEHSE